MTESERNHILYFQRWQREYHKGSVVAREMGEFRQAIEYQEKAAECYATIRIWRGW